MRAEDASRSMLGDGLLLARLGRQNSATVSLL